MIDKLLFVFVLSCFGYFANCAKDLPSYFPRCYRDLPQDEFNKCLLKATDTVRPFLQKGVRELNIPSISPLLIPEITLEQGTDATNYKAYAKNISLYGLDGYKFIRNNFDWKSLTYNCEVELPYLYIRGIYVVKGKFLSAPLNGEGIFWGNITESRGTLNVKSKIVTKNNQQYIENEKMVTNVTVGNVIDYGIDGLFKDNEVLAKATQTAIRENLAEIINEMKPAIQELMSKLFKDILLKSFHKIPLDKLYPLRNT